ncbi:MAG: coenzyme F420-0:L-glutamate ligase [Candidatus Dojkabacteria bacterium]|jgi:F420-0:gamma-glutamyl ligase
MRYTGTVVRGIRTPIISSGDDLGSIVVNSIVKASKKEKFELKDSDIIGITEAVLSISQQNYISLDDIGKEVKKKLPVDDIALVFPILSRNRFSMILEAIAKEYKKVFVLLSYPADEVGNHIMDEEKMYKLGLNPYSDSFTERRYRNLFGKSVKHKFTGIDYVKYYKSFGDNVKIYFSNKPEYILKYCKNILACDIHTRKRTKSVLKRKGANMVYGLDDICNRKNSKKGYNKEYGLLGSNRATDDKLKLFPRDCDLFVREVQKLFKKYTGKNVEVLIYGDGAFKDPVGKIWELADPVVSPGFTEGLKGQPKEVKLKYISENWDGENDLEEYVKKIISEKHTEKYESKKSLGTTPRQITDLLGTLCDLTSGSGDKGTPVVYIQGYFDDRSVE